MMESTKKRSPLKVVMFPWLGYGHITPYLELAKNLSTRGFKIYICSTLATLSCIDDKITEKLSHSIKLVPILLPVLPDLPRKFHTTNGLPPNLMPKLKEALDSPSAVEAFSDILLDIKPDFLIYDCLQPWSSLVAKKLRIPPIQFITSSSTMTSFMFHYFKNPDVEFPYKKIKFRDYESINRSRLMATARNQSERERASEGVDRSYKIVLIKGCRHIEDKYIDYVTSLVGKKFVPVGPLVQEPDLDERDGEGMDVVSWLDKKERKSTIFVSFGSEYFLSREDMVEIAHGLERSKVNFIWVVRFPKNSKGPNVLLNKTLPEGFFESIGDRGKILEGWAPQAKILGHPNIGGFVSHCGWNSILESMNFGVPIIAVPMHLDQPINARLVEEVGVGVEVLRDSERRLCRKIIADVIKQVVMESGGERVRKNALEMKEKLRSKGDQETDEVVRELMAVREEFNKEYRLNGYAKRPY